MTVSGSDKSVQKVAIADHIWEAFDEMAGAMGADKESLVNQALFMYARLNGFLTPGGGNGVAEVDAAAAPRRAPSPPPAPPAAPPSEPPPAAEPPPPPEAESPPTGAIRPSAAKGGASASRPAAGGAAAPAAPAAGAKDAARAPASGAQRRRTLYLVTENGQSERVDKDRFLIGRDKKCDFVIESGKVSREHAVVTREADGWYVEDLNSSNGTWYKQERIDRRKIEDGDVFYICNEKITTMFR